MLSPSRLLLTIGRKNTKKEVTTLIELADALQKPVIELLPDEGYEIEILEKMPDTGWKTL